MAPSNVKGTMGPKMAVVKGLEDKSAKKACQSGIAKLKEICPQKAKQGKIIHTGRLNRSRRMAKRNKLMVPVKLVTLLTCLG